MTEGELGVSGDVRREIALRISVLARLMRNRFDRQVGELNVTRSQWTMIVVVARNPGATQRTIADTLEISEASAGRLIDRLCSDGLLQRVERDDDRRARAVYLTPAAEPLIEKLTALAKVGEERAFRGMADEEIAQLSDLLGRLYKNVA